MTSPDIGTHRGRPILHVLGYQEATHQTGYSYPTGTPWSQPHAHLDPRDPDQPPTPITCRWNSKGHCKAYEHLGVVQVDLPGTAADRITGLPAFATLDAFQGAYRDRLGDHTQQVWDAWSRAARRTRGVNYTLQVRIDRDAARQGLRLMKDEVAALHVLATIASDHTAQSSLREAGLRIRKALRTLPAT